MPLPWSTEVRDAQKARRRASAWLLEIFSADVTLRAWDQRIPVNFGGDDYEPLSGKWGIEGQIRGGRDLVPQPLTIWLDGSDEFKEGSFTQRFLASTWHLRQIRVREIAMVPSTHFTEVIGETLTWIGFIETIDLPFGGISTRIPMNCESGTFRAKAREMHTVTDADQRIRDADDASFANLALKSFQDIPFGESWVNVAGSPEAIANSASITSNAAKQRSKRGIFF